jgi:ADP-heptose:LPS heptosyltransferase
VGIHASGGRAIKQWDADRFAAVADRLAREHGAAIVLTGTAEDRELVEGVARRLPAAARTVDLAGAIELPLLAAILERLDLLVTGDTGPMHLAAAVGTPVVAIFGPSDPARYAPLEAASAIVRIDLPCSPCNRIRLPPERCVGHTPDCLAGVSVEQVHAAAVRLLEKGR